MQHVCSVCHSQSAIAISMQVKLRFGIENAQTDQCYHRWCKIGTREICSNSDLSHTTHVHGECAFFCFTFNLWFCTMLYPRSDGLRPCCECLSMDSQRRWWTSCKMMSSLKHQVHMHVSTCEAVHSAVGFLQIRLLVFCFCACILRANHF